MIVDWLIRRAMRTPYYHLTGYMERYWLVPYGATIQRTVDGVPVTDGTGPVNPRRRPFARVLQKLGIAARIHHILRSDRGRDPHDHPWPYVAIILKGGYFEQRYDENGAPMLPLAEWHGPGSVIYRPANSLHKLILPEGATAWTLFITFKKVQTWGFKPLGQPKIPYYDYKEEP